MTSKPMKVRQCVGQCVRRRVWPKPLIHKGNNRRSDALTQLTHSLLHTCARARIGIIGLCVGASVCQKPRISANFRPDAPSKVRQATPTRRAGGWS